jgi:hypothetical protein
MEPHIQPTIFDSDNRATQRHWSEVGHVGEHADSNRGNEDVGSENVTGMKGKFTKEEAQLIRATIENYRVVRQALNFSSIWLNH